MSNSITTIVSHYKKAIKDHDEYIKYWMDPSDPYKWWCIIHNMCGEKDALKGGEYLVEVTAPKEFPFKPPTFYLHTPNGVYGTDKPICISIGHYHADAYPAAIGMRGFITEVANGMMCQKDLGGGINVLQFNESKIKAFAAASRAFNLEKYPIQTLAVLEAYDEYKKSWEENKPTPPPAIPKASSLASMFKRKAPPKNTDTPAKTEPTP